MRSTRELVLIAGGLTLAYLFLSKKLAEFTGEGSAIDEWIARPIAYVISKFTLPAQFHVPGGVVFQDGGYVSWDAIIDAGSKLDSSGFFHWRGQRYKVYPRRTDGNYPAIPA